MTYRIVNDDDPFDIDYPSLVDSADYDPVDDAEILAVWAGMEIGESRTVGGGAAVQFTITRLS